jgi:hypothetical protein
MLRKVRMRGKMNSKGRRNKEKGKLKKAPHLSAIGRSAYGGNPLPKGERKGVSLSPLGRELE